MKKLYMTNEARQNAIAEIERQINVLGTIKSEDLTYIDYRAIIKNLNELKNIILSEME